MLHTISFPRAHFAMIHLCGNTYPDTPWIWPAYLAATSVYVLATLPLGRTLSRSVWVGLGLICLLLTITAIEGQGQHADNCEPSYMPRLEFEMTVLWISSLVIGIAAKSTTFWPSIRYAVGLSITLLITTLVVFNRGDI